MENLIVNITRFVDGSFPGWVECEFVDADGRLHKVIDKFPVLSLEVLDENSRYPQLGTNPCEVLGRCRDDRGRDIARITTQRPYWIESIEGLTEFVVLPSMLEAILNLPTVIPPPEK